MGLNQDYHKKEISLGSLDNKEPLYLARAKPCGEKAQGGKRVPYLEYRYIVLQIDKLNKCLKLLNVFVRLSCLEFCLHLAFYFTMYVLASLLPFKCHLVLNICR